MRTSVLLLLVVACGDPKRESKAAPPVERRKVDTIAMTLPEGWASSYDANNDRWTFTRDRETILFERTPEASAASPEALRQWLRFNVWDKGTEAEIVSREALADGFAVTFSRSSRRETYVIKQIHPDDWFRCFSTSEQTLALCTSLKRRSKRAP